MHIKPPHTHLLFFTALVLVLFTRLLVYLGYNLQIVDTDQAYMWLGARDYALGHFYEPRYYGQDYNTYMEALFAVPLLWLQIPVYVALPAATHVIALFPFLITALCLYFLQRQTHAYAVLAVLLCLPPQYDLLNSLPRGFVTGLFFNAAFIVSVLYPHRLGWLALNTGLALLGYFVNQNSVIVSAPFLFYGFLHNYTNRRYYIRVVPVLLLYLPLYALFDAFYKAHPDYILQGVSHSFSAKSFFDSISNLDSRFQHISFFVPKQSAILLATMAITAYFLFRQNRKAFYAFLVFLLVLLVSFASDKVAGGCFWVFMSYSRMYLGIPLALALFFSLLAFEWRPLYRWLAPLPVLYAVVKLWQMGPELKKEDIRDKAMGVRVLTVDQCLDITGHYRKLCKEHGAEFFLVSTTFWYNTIVSCAGPAFHSDYPETQETRFEKRYWVRNGNQNRVVERFVLLSSDYNLDQLMPANGDYEMRRLDDYGLFLVSNNKLPMGQFIARVNAYEPELNE